MIFENTERKIISHVFNADPKMIPTITHIYKLNAELMRDEFKEFSIIFGEILESCGRLTKET